VLGAAVVMLALMRWYLPLEQPAKPASVAVAAPAATGVDSPPPTSTGVDSPPPTST
jgi:hypothetical protein